MLSSQHLATLLHTQQYAAVPSYLASLSNAERRRAGVLLGETLLPRLSNAQFWEAFATIVAVDRKAYLGTFLKAASRLIREGKLTVCNPHFEAFCATATPTDCRKILEALLPYICDPDMGQRLLTLCPLESDAQTLSLLCHTHTLICDYLIFQHLRRLDPASPEIRATAIAIIKRRGERSYSVAYLIQQYFGLEALPCTFSRHIESYALSRLEGNFVEWRHLLQP